MQSTRCCHVYIFILTPNGVMERNNNTCKLIKRISYGFRNFKNMRSRILIITNVFRKEKRKYYTKYSTPKYV